jgi:hypothetical protein
MANRYITQQGVLGQVQLDVGPVVIIVAQVVWLDTCRDLEERRSISEEPHHGVVTRVDGGP